jgi:hypothetical protein
VRLGKAEIRLLDLPRVQDGELVTYPVTLNVGGTVTIEYKFVEFSGRDLAEMKLQVRCVRIVLR